MHEVNCKCAFQKLSEFFQVDCSHINVGSINIQSVAKNHVKWSDVPLLLQVGGDLNIN